MGGVGQCYGANIKATSPNIVLRPTVTKIRATWPVVWAVMVKAWVSPGETSLLLSLSRFRAGSFVAVVAGSGINSSLSVMVQVTDSSG